MFELFLFYFGEDSPRRNRRRKFYWWGYRWWHLAEDCEVYQDSFS